MLLWPSKHILQCVWIRLRIISNIILRTTINLYYKIVWSNKVACVWFVTLRKHIIRFLWTYSPYPITKFLFKFFTSCSLSSFVHVVFWSIGNLSRENTPVSNIVILSKSSARFMKKPSARNKDSLVRRRREQQIDRQT